MAPKAEDAVVEPEVAGLGEEGGDGERQDEHTQAFGAQPAGDQDLVGG
jgi:hypothetical protein